MKKKIAVVLLSAGIAVGLCPSAHAQTTTNILDTFNRNGALNATAPDIAQTGGDVWAASSTTQLITTNTPNGRLIYTGNGSYAKLPFLPQSGFVYTVSLTLNIANTGSTSDRWGAFGFDDGTLSGAFNCGNVWMLCKFDGQVQAFDHALTDNFYAGSAGTAFKNGTNNLLQIVLDTTAASWKAQVKVNGAAVGPVHTLASTSITKVAIWGNALSTAGRNATNQLLSVTSIQPQAPSITGQPVGVTNWAGVTASLNVAATGAQPIDYYWFKGSVANPVGTDADTLNFAPLAGTDSGSYFVICSNSIGSVTSSVVNVHAESTSVMVLTPSISAVALPGTGTDAATGFATNNTYISALNFATDTTPLSVNDVVFDRINPNGLQATNGVDPTYGGSWALSKATVLGTTLSSFAGDATGQADGSMLTLLNDSVGLTGSVNIGDTLTVQLGSVVPTGQYVLYVLFRNWDSIPLNVSFNFQGQGSNEVVSLDENLGATPNSGGAYLVKYSFTAITNRVTVGVAGTQAGRTARIYATVLQQISAPLVVPSISSQPVGFTNWANVSGSMSVSADGSVPLHYQWYQGTTSLTDKTNATLSFPSLSTNDSGSYTVIITNVAGSATSSVASVLVYETVWPYSPQLSLVQLPAASTDASCDISTNNTYVCALDFGNDTTPLSVNDVVFEQLNLSGPGTGTTNLPVFSGIDSTYGGSWTLVASNSAPTSTGIESTGGATAQADGSMGSLLSDLSYLPGTVPVGNYARLTLGVTPTAKYSLRYYYRQWTANRLVDFTFDGQGTNETVRVDLDSGGARYLKYDFTAANTNVDMTMTVATTGNGPHIYAVTLQQTAPAAVAAVLHTSVSGAHLTISWDVSITGYTLESTASLSPASWSPVGGVTNNSVTVNDSTGTQFYRLKK